MKWLLIFAICIGTIAFLIVSSNKNNVCKSFDDYYSDRDKNPNCYYNPDHELEVPEIVRRHGYPLEIHNVTTDDGYILTVFRIPYGRHGNTTSKKPVFLQHGLTLNGGAFIIMGEKSLAFMLANAGYDVWLGNFRGSRYSSSHSYLNSQSEVYWNFTQLNRVRTITRQKIIYVGFSMGATAAYIYFSVYPNQMNIDLFIGFAPAIYAEDSMLVTHVVTIWPLVAGPLQYLTNGRLYPRALLPQSLYKLICFPYPIQIKVCQIIEMIYFGFNYEENDPETLPVTLQYNSDTASVNTVWHYCQVANSNKFQYYDYGEIGNREKYNSSTPPLYSLSNVNVENHLFYATNDKLTTDKSVRRLFNDLPNNYSHKLHKIDDEHFNHLSFVAGKNAHRLVYQRVIDFLKTIGKT
ncbi:hypothetical protein RI129_007189 [Pyrocoelia pectoralis]|uniref:Lipase n=1 Tax=Pyrocoelia pectoralis TaxID=417401 RepID=A0AAN7VBW8_9COLE